jgi:hypothetical protein
MKARVSRAAAALAVIGIGLSAGSVQGASGLEMYQHVKGVENKIPLPNSYATGKVGTLQGGTGKFTGLVTTTEIDYDPTEPGGPKKPQKTYETPSISVNAVNVGLVFEVSGGSGEFSVTANGRTVKAQPGQSRVEVNVGRAVEVRWTARRGSRSYSDEITIVRPMIVGAGAFTVPALPVAVVYEPPQDRLKRNTASYSKMKSVGTTVGMSFSQESSSTKESTAKKFQGAMQAKERLNQLASAAEKVPNPYVQAAAVGLRLIASGLGSTSATETKGTKVTTANELSLSTGQTDVFTTSAHQGPGRGDRLIYLKNARMLWIVANGSLELTLLGHTGISAVTVGYLQDNVKGLPGLNEETIRSMLSLDPLVKWNGESPNSPGSRNPILLGPRFRHVEQYEINGGEDTHSFSTSITQSDLKASCDYTTRTEEYRKGWLSFVGAGVTENETVKTNVTHGSSEEVTEGMTVECSVKLFAEADEMYGVDAYYDAVFGTFAFVPAQMGDQAYVSGQAKKQDGQPAARQVITVEIGGRKYSTRTDAEGRYALRSLALRNARGEARLKAGGTQQKLQLNGMPVQQDLQVVPEPVIRPQGGGGIIIKGRD